MEAAGYDDLRAQQRSRRADASARKALGIGLSVYVEITGGGPSEEYGSIEIRPDEVVTVEQGNELTAGATERGVPRRRWSAVGRRDDANATVGGCEAPRHAQRVVG